MSRVDESDEVASLGYAFLTTVKEYLEIQAEIRHKQEMMEAIADRREKAFTAYQNAIKNIVEANL